MTEKLEPEAKRLRKLSPGELADEIGALEARHDVLKAEAIRRELHRAEGESQSGWRLTCTALRKAGDRGLIKGGPVGRS
jgi:hypothetical protein